MEILSLKLAQPLMRFFVVLMQMDLVEFLYQRFVCMYCSTALPELII
jgi:hypothetical protein